MPNDLAILKVDSEEVVFDFLAQYLEGQGHFNAGAILDFEGFPPLVFELQGEHFKGTITPGVMKAFLELQKSIYKSYALAKYNDENINRLTKHEKTALELVVKVGEGSSIFQLDAQEILTQMAANMTGEQVVIVVLGLGAIYFSYLGFKHHLTSQKELKSQHLTSDVEIRRLESIEALSEQETRRMEIMAQVQQREPVVRRSAEIAAVAKDEMLSAFSEADNFVFDGVSVSGEAVSALMKTKRNVSNVERVDGFYRVVSVDSSDPLSFKIRVRNENGVEFMAVVMDETLDNRHKSLIQQAEWNRDLVYLRITAKLISGAVKEATVIGAGSE